MKSFLFFLLFTLSLPLVAQEAQPLEIDHLIASEAFGDERKITVYLPPNYYNRPEERYTITYVLDGHYAPFIDLVVKTIEYNVNARKFTPTIVVGIHAKRRGMEFSAPMSDDEDQQGRAPALRQHFEQEVFPLVESMYPEALDYRSIIGHSSGGTFVLNTLFSEGTDLFDGYLAISPALRPGQNNILADAEKLLAGGGKFPKFLYCSAGTVGEREELFGGAIDRLDALLERFPNHGLIWKQSRFEGLDHWSVVAPSVTFGGLAQTRAFRADEKVIVDFARNDKKDLREQLERFYTNKSTEYGFVHLPQSRYLRMVAEEVERIAGKEKSIALLDWGMDHYPDDFLLLKQQSILRAEMGQPQLAKAGFTRCLQLLQQQQEELSESRFAANKEDLEERLAAIEE